MEYEVINSETTEQVIEEITEVTEEAPRQTVGFWEFFGLTALFSVPVVGFIACIVFMFAPKRKVMKNYARAVMAWLGVRIVSAVAVCLIVLNIVGNAVLPSINQSLGTDFKNIFQVVGIAKDVATKNYAGLIKAFSPQLVDSLGSEYEPLLDELSNKKYNNMFEDIIEKDYDDLLLDLKSGKYDDLKKAIGSEKFDSLVSEVEAAATGRPSEFLSSISELGSLMNLK